eukprot:gene12982-15344_t
MASFKASPVAPWWVMTNPLAWFLWSLDFLLWLVSTIGPIKYLQSLVPKRYSVQVPGAPKGVRRAPGFEKELMTSAYPGVTTGFEVLQRSYEKFASKPALGTRKYLGEYKPEGAKFGLKKFGETEWLTFAEAGKTSLLFGAGLRKLGMQPLSKEVEYEQSTSPSTMLLYEDTSAKWTLAAHGAMSQGIVVATSYATLGMDSVAGAVQETLAPVIVCNYKSVAKVVTLASKCPSLTTIIYTDFHVEPDTPPPAVNSALKVISFDEVVALGAKYPVPPSPPSPDCLALLMYTSGSTGKPKGVMIKHSSLVAAVGGVYNHIKGAIVEGEECYLAYLPAAHILEFTAQLSFFSYGSSIGYADPRTISSKGAVRQRPDGTINTKPEYPYPPGGIQEFRPSTMAAVPKVWDILKKGVEDSMASASPLVRFLFAVAYAGRTQALKAGRDSPLFKAVVFKKVKAMMGGRMRIALSGGGPVSSELQTFVRTVFCMPLIQGYALTETCSIGCIQDLADGRDGIVGAPLASVEMKLAPCGEVMDKNQQPYSPEDKTHYGMPCAGRGEVCIRGPPVAVGYYKQPDKTAEAWDSENWFHTGDIGVWHTDGTLSLVDRLKNLVKLKGGEYIALEAMEKEYSNSEYVNGVNGGLMVHGTGDMDRPGAIVQVNMHKLEAWAKGAGISFTSSEELCSNPAVVKEVMRTMDECHKIGALGGNEKLATVALISGSGDPTVLTATSPWGPGVGLTASNKLDRKAVVTALHAAIDLLEKAGT